MAPASVPARGVTPSSRARAAAERPAAIKLAITSVLYRWNHAEKRLEDSADERR